MKGFTKAMQWAVVLAIAGSGWASSVLADETPYRTWHRKGAQALKKRAYDKALEAFKAAVAADPTEADGYFNAGSVARHLKRCRDVLLYFRGFLYLSPGTEDDRIAKAALKECERKGETGRIAVQSEPTGAEVFVGGVLVGQAPLPDLVLPVGEWTVEFRHPDCEVHREVVTVKADEPARVVAALPLKPAFGYLEVVTTPAEGVTVWVGDKEVGVTPIEKVKWPVGKVLVRLEKPGFDPWVRAVMIQRERTYRLEATLEPAQPGIAGEGDLPGKGE